MLKRLNKYLTIISLLIAVLTSGYGFFMKVRADVLRDERNNAYDELEVKTTEVIKYQNKLGQEVTKTIEYTKKLSQLEQSKDSVELRLYETISASMLKEKQLEKAFAITYEASNKMKYDSIVRIENYVLKSSPVKIEPIKYNKIRYFDDGYLQATCYPDSLEYTYRENIDVITAKRLIERKFFLWKWIGWKKMVDRDLVEIVSDNPNSSINGRMIRIEN